jgi:deoxycytidine triphosphate deaminase
MILTNDEITNLIAGTTPLIANHVNENIESCGYTFRIGKVFEPSTGDVIELNVTNASTNKKKVIYEIKPSETVIIMTEEQLNMPDHICGDYSIKNSLASKGLMLINASIVLPKYRGPLSCFIVNFSNKTIPLKKDEEVARIVFHRLTGVPTKFDNKVLTSQQYEESLAKNALQFSKTFMNIREIEAQIVEKAGASAKKNIIFGSIMISFFLLWSTLEPIITRKIWGGEVYLQNENLLNSKYQLELAKKDNEMRILNNRVDSIQKILKGK